MGIRRKENGNFSSITRILLQSLSNVQGEKIFKNKQIWRRSRPCFICQIFDIENLVITNYFVKCSKTP